MKTCYVAGRYSAETDWGVHENIHAAMKVSARLWSLGWAALCPHANSAHFGGVVPYESFLEGDLAFLRRCDAVVLVPGWEESKGAVAEREEALRCGIPVFVWPDVPHPEAVPSRGSTAGAGEGRVEA